MTVEHRELLVVQEQPEALLEALARWQPPVRPKWLDRAQARAERASRPPLPSPTA